MSPEDLVAYVDQVKSVFETLKKETDEISPTPDDRVSGEISGNALAEALFLRAFTYYESCLDDLFFHYVTAGKTLKGSDVQSYLNVSDVAAARKLVKGSMKFLSWSKPDTIRETATTYLKDGWPLADIMATGSSDLHDAEKIRNRIAHDSLEARNAFNAVQRNVFGTERIFDITPGQLLRVRHRTKRITNLSSLLAVMEQTITSIIDPPA